MRAIARYIDYAKIVRVTRPPSNIPVTAIIYTIRRRDVIILLSHEKFKRL
jgi:hypothetical protein